ncbi:hypothetical protein MTP09_00040 [Chryseobacterium suipulveris]|uniref:Uncharacterized protein n=1 Tax=Chryseobacterium suipulveris TaxID=2929800 RepID=A0ABY4BPE3_9FLAO|nr:DUF2683 family protein [Chryseobacterium suipulveris]UOE41074.1 hypothetical protein MTP09_00040 [Chryseobacterium suipulveris]
MTITINPKNQKELRKVKTFLKAIEVDFWESKDHPETAYLNSTEANKKHLQASLKEAEEEKLVEIKLDDLWK